MINIKSLKTPEFCRFYGKNITWKAAVGRTDHPFSPDFLGLKNARGFDTLKFA